MIIQASLAILIFAFVPLAIKSTNATAVTICFIRLLMTVGILSILWIKKIQFDIKHKNFKKLIILGIVFFFHWISYAYAVKMGGPSIGVLGLSTYGIQLLVASSLFLGHKITRSELVCLILCAIGVAFIIPSWKLADDVTVGAVLALFSATCFAVIPILHKNSQEFNKETRIYFQFFGAFLCFSLFVGSTHWSQLSIHDWWMLFFLGVFGTLIAHSFWAHITTKISPTAAGMSYYSIAPITLLLSHFFLGENFTLTQIVGAIIVIASAMWSSYNMKQS
jgi:drug/metabolite transporter (DMT)-like permease